MRRSEGLTDRIGFTWAELTWNGDTLERLAVPGATVICERVQDDLLGDAHAIVGDRELTRISAIDWARPTEIPAIAAPGRLPPGAGGAIMNVLAILAERAGVASLHYAGPYPTNALWRTLSRSFRTTGTEVSFSEHLIDRMICLARDPIPIEFTPAPHQRIAISGGHVELRGRLERAVIDGVSYEPDGSPAVLSAVELPEEIGPRAELWFGDRRYAEIARFLADGTVIVGPNPPPVCTSTVIGQSFPPALVGALAELVSDAMPTLLARDARAWFRDRALHWADLGARSCRVRDGVLEFHAALWDHVGPHGLGRLALALAGAAAPVVTMALVGDLSRAR